MNKENNKNMKITLSKKQWQFIGRKTGWIKTASDEWSDEKTVEFAKQVASVMTSDSNVKVNNIKGNTIYFDYFNKSFNTWASLLLELTEFGYAGASESVNGRIRSEENPNFRIPGGFTRNRNPQELWLRAKEFMDEILKKAFDSKK